MDVPDLVAQRLGGETPEDVVRFGDESAAFVTPSKTIIYRGEGLLSDESVGVYEHDIERLSVSEGRRKTTFTLASVDGTAQFSVPRRHGDAVLEGLLGGVLGVAGVLADDETIAGVYRFSELTVVVTSTQLVKHIGTSVWDEEYETYPFADVTGLEFEDGSVATQVVLWVNGRPERIKAPNDEAPMLQRALTEALCTFHNVTSLTQLNETLAPEDADTAEDPTSRVGLDDSITPLVGTDEGASDETTTETATTSDHAVQHTTAQQTPTGGQSADDPTRQAGDDDLRQQVADLTAAVERQNRLLERHHEAIVELLDRLEE
jgi:hypothetical protein